MVRERTAGNPRLLRRSRPWVCPVLAWIDHQRYRPAAAGPPSGLVAGVVVGVAR